MLTRADKFLIVFLCLLAIGGIVYELWGLPSSKTMLELSVNGQKQQLHLNDERTLSVAGVYGDMQIEIKAGKVRVKQAFCPDHVCEKTGWISKAPQRIICVPNKIIVSIIADNTDIDVIIQ